MADLHYDPYTAGREAVTTASEPAPHGIRIATSWGRGWSLAGAAGARLARSPG
jgi:hypothetical protein